MCDIFVEEARDYTTTTWFSPVKSEPYNSKSADISQSPEYWQSYRALAGSPFDSSSDSSSDCEDDTISLGSSDPFSDDVSLVSEGIKTLKVMEGNALGLIFMAKENVLATEAVATLAQQAEGLRAPRHHQDDRSCGRPNQKHHVQQGPVAFQSDGPADDTLVRGFPQDIGLWTDVSDDIGPKVFQGLYGSRDGYVQETYDYPKTPAVKTISLPDEQELLYSGPELGGWLTGTLDGVPKTMLGGLSDLDIGLPMPFAMVY